MAYGRPLSKQLFFLNIKKREFDVGENKLKSCLADFFGAYGSAFENGGAEFAI